ncbi:hypothetical protein HK101_006297 [Irineochytrium annulatum]|nr:hypothetical protein HK101_006297 [Irineochytrium annulatum]
MKMTADFDVDAFVDCARYGELDEVKEMLRSWASPTAAGSTTAIDPADPSLDAETARSLIITRASAGYTAFHVAAANGESGILSFLLPYLQPTDLALGTTLDGSTALHWAALNGKADCVGILLAAGADATIKNDDGRSSITVAEQQEHFEIVNMLLKTFEPQEDVTGGAVDEEDATTASVTRLAEEVQAKLKASEVAAGGEQ